MAGPPGTPPDPLALFEALARSPWEFSFFQALRRIEVTHQHLPRLGEAARPADEPVRLEQVPSMGFAPSTVSRFTPPDGSRPARLASQFMGLFGPNGALPLHITEHAQDRIRDEGDPALSRFADIFHHRLFMLFYRAWASAEPVRSHDRPASDDFARQVASLLGLGLPGFAEEGSISPLLKLHFAGRFAMQTRNAEGLCALLSVDLGVPIEIQEFVGSWVQIPPPARWRLGRGKQSARLGSTAILGGRVWQHDQKFRIVVGPLGPDRYDDFLSGGRTVARLQALVRSYVGDELDWELRVIAEQRARPALMLGRGRLGRNAWLGPRPNVKAQQDVTYEPARASA